MDLRKNKGVTERIYIVNRNVDDENVSFDILGSSLKIYKVSLKGSPKCSCMDFIMRHKRCKHIYFMLSKIFNVVDVDKKFFTEDELNVYINKYRDNISRNVIKYNENNEIDVGVKCLEDDCAICLEPLLDDENTNNILVYCKKNCGRVLHGNCYNMVLKVSNKCPYCRDEMDVGIYEYKKGEKKIEKEIK